MKHQIMEAEVCSEHHHHMNLHVPQISPDDLYQLADLFKAFGDPTRLRILYTLSEGELCVCDIDDAECHFPPASYSERKTSGKSPPGW